MPIKLTDWISLTALGLGHAVPILGIFLFNWNLPDLLALYWFEGVVIGVVALAGVMVSGWGAVLGAPVFAATYSLGVGICLFLVWATIRATDLPWPLADLSLAIAAIILLCREMFQAFRRHAYVRERSSARETAVAYEGLALLYLGLAVGAMVAIVSGQATKSLVTCAAIIAFMDLLRSRRELFRQRVVWIDDASPTSSKP